MIVLVADTSVLIDLERAALIGAALALPHDFVVPDALYQAELESYDGAQLVAAGLRIESLDDTEVTAAAMHRRERNRLSVIDTLALALAEGRGWHLLAGDALLREAAAASGVTCHGTLWVVDQIEASGTIEPEDLAQCLRQLSNHPRCRLPRREVETRIKRLNGG